MSAFLRHHFLSFLPVFPRAFFKKKKSHSFIFYLITNHFISLLKKRNFNDVKLRYIFAAHFIIQSFKQVRAGVQVNIMMWVAPVADGNV